MHTEKLTRVMRLGLVVNPIAGMGGRLAFKGSDDVALVAAARERGESLIAPARATEALRPLAALGGGLEVLVYAGEMGEQEASEAQPRAHCRGPAGPVTSAAGHARSRRRRWPIDEVDLLLFAGGDGTAVDVFEAIGDRVPVLGIPAGVKMHSAVFALNPRSAGELAARLAQGRGSARAPGRGDGRRRGAAPRRLDLGPPARFYERSGRAPSPPKRESALARE